MDTLYFIGFCGLAAFVCFWSLRNDDGEEFSKSLDDGKFRLPGKSKDKKDS